MIRQWSLLFLLQIGWGAVRCAAGSDDIKKRNVMIGSVKAMLIECVERVCCCHLACRGGRWVGVSKLC